MLKRFFEVLEDIGQFMEKMGSPVRELNCPQWVQDLAFMADIIQHLNNRNKMLLSITTITIQVKTVTLGDAAI